MTLLRYTHYTLEDIEKFIECPEFGNSNYGKWGTLKLEQRLAIKSLCYEIRDYQARLRMTINDIIEAYQDILDEWQIFSDSQHLSIAEDGRIRVCLRNYNWYVTKEPIKDPLTLVKAIFEIDWICEFDEEEKFYDENKRNTNLYSKYWKRF